LDEKHKKLLEELSNLGPWYHEIDLGHGIKTEAMANVAYNPEKRWKLMEPHIPKDLTGKTVIDLACNDGYFSIQMKKRGAKRVVGVDNREENLKKCDFLCRWFDVEVETILADVQTYCLTTDERFDYVFCLGLFYHLKYPVLVLDRIAEMTKSRLFFQTIRIDGPKVSNFIPKDDYTGVNKFNEINDEKEFPKMFFIEKKFNGVLRNFWIPNDAAIYGLLRSAGMKIIARAAPVPLFICEPEFYYGKKIYDKCVFPSYGYKDVILGP